MKCYRFILVWILFSVALCSGAFGYAFGPKPSYPGPSLVAPLLVDGFEMAQAWVFPRYSEGDFLIEFTPLYTILKSIVDEDILLVLSQERLDQGLISSHVLSELQIPVKFDEVTLQITIEIPPHFKKKRTLDLNNGTYFEDKKILGPSPASGYLNLRFNKNFYQVPIDGNDSESSLNVNIENSTTLNGWNFLTGAESVSWDQKIWRRTDTVVSHDNETDAIRYRFGDIYTPMTAFSSSLALGGFSASRELSIQPYRNVRPLNNTEIFLERPSWIEVAVNKNVVARFFSGAGAVNLQSYPLVYGINDIVVKVTDEMGKEEILKLSSYYDYSLVPVGSHRFSYNIGYPATNDNLQRIYDTENPTAMLRHEYGLEDTWTLAGAISRESSVSVLSVESRWASELGLFSSFFGTSKRDEYRPYFSGKLGFRSFDQGGRDSRGSLFSTNIEYSEAKFITVGAGGVPSGYSWKYDWLVTRQLEKNWTVAFGQNSFVGLNSIASRTNYQLRIGKNFKSDFQLGVNFEKKYERGTEDSIFINFNWREKSPHSYQRQSYVSGSHDSNSKMSRFNYTNQPSSLIGGLRFNAGLQRDEERTGVDAQLQHLNNRGDFKIYQASSTSPQANYSKTQLNYGTSLGWTKNSFSWSRPIADSFVLFRDVNNSGLSIPVNSSGDSFESLITESGAGILPDVLSYHKKEILIDGNKLPDGYSIEPQFLAVKPTYRTGVEVPVYVKAQSIIQGVLLKEDNLPLGLEAGEVDVFDNDKWVPTFITFFTTEKGHYFIQNLIPGKTYQLRFFNGELFPMQIVLHPNDVGIVRLPPQRIEKWGDKNE